MPPRKRSRTPTATGRSSKRTKEATDSTGAQADARNGNNGDDDSSGNQEGPQTSPDSSTSNNPEKEKIGEASQESQDSSAELPIEGLVVTVDDSQMIPVKTVKIEHMFPGKPEAAKRLHKLIHSKGHFPLAVNLATVQSEILSVKLNEHIKTPKPKPMAIVFSIYGVIRFAAFDLKKSSAFSKQLGFIPFHPRWGRACAILRECVGLKYLYSRTFRSALVAQSDDRDVSVERDEQNVKQGKQGKGKETQQTRLDNGTREAERPFRPKLPRNWDVPVYDGRKPFAWCSYKTNLPRLGESQLEEGMACAIMCTISTYRTGDKTNSMLNKGNVKASLMFNLLGVVVLEDPDPGRKFENADTWAPDLTDVVADLTLDVRDCVDEDGVEQPPTADPSTSEGAEII